MVRSNVKKIMKRKNVTIRSLAAESGLSDRTILRARSPHIVQCRLYTLHTIARPLECQVKDLFEESAQQRPELEPRNAQTQKAEL